MPELRWILLGLGLLFCLGLWWRESRRPRQAASSSARAGEPVRQDPVIAPPEPPRHVLIEQEPELPQVLLPDDPTLPTETEPPFAPPPEAAPAVAAKERLARELFSRPVAEMLERIEPILGDTEIIDPDSPAAEPLRPPPEEKIVTLRLAAPPLERFDGRELVDALRAAGLEHGKFSIFHKVAPNGATLMSVASLVEPGTFDLDRIEAQRFPGISLFSVLPGPMDAGATLDMMVGIARDLAARLRGVVQDERGVPMSPQRLADLRVGLMEWQRRADAAI
ncbi:MAG TPA: cell division protein ZipA C-terminal FtsZ-binding domain-containing protein [Steroidobacteraceae bacterium]|nr:cell division protein ZipA C-terminal FtsZ-binding domain-containing protein [Steroidobacteraceae bacterium]